MMHSVASLKRLIALLTTCLAVAAGAPAVAASAPQPLSISVRGDGARATRLAQYDPREPIAVDVTNGGTQRLDALTIVARGPHGESIRQPLLRAPDGSFRGSLTLGDQGAWQLRLTSRAGSLSTETTPVSLDVHAPPAANAAALGVAVGTTIFVIVGGGGFLLLRRTVSGICEQLDNAA